MQAVLACVAGRRSVRRAGRTGTPAAWGARTAGQQRDSAHGRHGGERQAGRCTARAMQLSALRSAGRCSTTRQRPVLQCAHHSIWREATRHMKACASSRATGFALDMRSSDLASASRCAVAAGASKP